MAVESATDAVLVVAVVAAESAVSNARAAAVSLAGRVLAAFLSAVVSLPWHCVALRATSSATM